MATYTAVMVVPNELSPEYVQQQLERLGVVAFCGPGSLVSEDALGDEEIAAMERESEGPSSVTLTMDGMGVIVTLERTPDGPLVQLRGKDCDLEGELPGAYYLIARRDG